VKRRSALFAVAKQRTRLAAASTAHSVPNSHFSQKEMLMAAVLDTDTGLDLFDLDVQVTVNADEIGSINLSAETHQTQCSGCDTICYSS